MKLQGMNKIGKYWRPAAGAVLGVAWLGFVVLAVAPVVRTAVSGHREMGDLEQRIVALDGWTSAKLLMKQDLDEHGPGLEATWARLFPAERGRERLFLDLARVADTSGVADFDLAEIVELDLDPGGPSQETVDVFDPMATDEHGPGAGSVQATTASVDLDSYRVRARWSGDYERTAAFLARLRDIPRALSVHSLAVRPHEDGIHVEMELEVYTDGATES